jgi:hypothetical protein
MLWTSGLSGVVVENTFRADDPAPATIWVGVTAIEKISPAQAALCQFAADGGVAEEIVPLSIVLVVRYCFD